MAALVVYAAANLEFPPRPGTLTNRGELVSVPNAQVQLTTRSANRGRDYNCRDGGPPLDSRTTQARIQSRRKIWLARRTRPPTWRRS